MLATPEIINIIKTGKLKTYSINGSFIEVYWLHETLPAHTYYLFVFTAMKQDLVKVTAVTPRFMPVKYQVKKNQPIIMRLMEGLV